MPDPDMVEPASMGDAPPKAATPAIPRQSILVAEWLLIALFAGYMGLRTLPRAWRTLNTDFPNYYLTARLAREHYDTSRVYEWTWLQRQKDHREIDQRVVGMVPITPFSTLMVWPLTSMPALAAKHCWLVANGFLLVATLILMRLLSGLAWRHILIMPALSLPLHANFLLGQYYVLLLFVLTLSCWLYIRERRFMAGIFIGIASGLKVFPIVFLLYFLRKRDLKAFAGGVLGALGTVIVSIWTFGWHLHRTYLFQVLPAVLRGEGLDPYNLKAASLASLLHRLFIFEPQLNPYPAINAPWLFALLHPMLQMALVAPAFLLARSHAGDPGRLRLEWAAILLASLAVSTSPASYLFTVLILPACLIWKTLDDRRASGVLFALFLVAFVGVGVVGGSNSGVVGWNALLKVPRLYGIIVLCVVAYSLLATQMRYKHSKIDDLVWAGSLSVILMSSVAMNIRHQRDLYAAYQWRLTLPAEIAMATQPAIAGEAIEFIALLPDGYHSVIDRARAFEFSTPSREDRLAVTAHGAETWVEVAGHESTTVSNVEGREAIQQAESPVASLDGRRLVFLRSERGRGRMWIRSLDHPTGSDTAMTPVEVNVLDMSFRPNEGLIFAASSGGAPSLFTVDEVGRVSPLGVDDARYPSVSPDGRWLAYSQLFGGNWNLSLRDLNSGQTRRLTFAACNDVDPAWTADSKTLIYGSDCGRGLWFTALCKRRVAE